MLTGRSEIEAIYAGKSNKHFKSIELENVLTMRTFPVKGSEKKFKNP